MKQIALLTLVASAAMVGCSSYDTPNHGKNVSMEPAHNFLGIVKVEPGSYSAIHSSTVRLKTDDFYSRRANTGDRVTLLWGAITLSDY